MKNRETAKQDRKEKLRAALERFRAGIEAIFADGRVEEFFRFANAFRRYSFHNAALIFAQRPDATLVAGIRKWNELGRRVRKGERGIMILAPVLVKKTVTVEDADGQAREEEREVLAGFKQVYVFDVAQTEGKPLPANPFASQVRPLEGEDEAGLFERLAAASPVRVEFGETRPAEGWWDPRLNKIVIGQHLSPAMRVKVILHELAHCLAGHGTPADGEQERDLREVVAEGAAYLAAQALGLDTADYSLGYVASWGKDMRKILTAGERIFATAEKVLALVEGPGTGRRGRRAA